MDISFKDEIPEAEREKIRKEFGMEDGPAPFEQEKMMEALERPEVEDVRVFKPGPKLALKKGQVIIIEGTFYQLEKLPSHAWG